MAADSGCQGICLRVLYRCMITAMEMRSQRHYLASYCPCTHNASDSVGGSISTAVWVRDERLDARR
jgi:ADP-ribosylglycohydrolase